MINLQFWILNQSGLLAFKLTLGCIRNFYHIMDKNKFNFFVFFTIILSASIFSLFDNVDSMTQLRKHFHSTEYKSAIELANTVIKSQDLNKDDMKEAFIIKGVSEFSSNHILDAKITFAQLILCDQNMKLDSKTVSPKIIKFYEKIKNEIISKSR